MAIPIMHGYTAYALEPYCFKIKSNNVIQLPHSNKEQNPKIDPGIKVSDF
jgi:hypothetical protein